MLLTPPFKPAKRGGFTLIEVILAIVIALGILVVLLYFYQQATNLRSQAIEQTEQVAAARLLMDRMTSELRTAQSQASGQGFSGSSNAIQFIHADVPSFTSWTGGALGRSAFPVSDLRVIRYELQGSDGTNVTGIFRSDEPLVAKHQAVSFDQPDAVAGPTNAAALPLIPEIRFLQFRYWSGTNWVDAWNGPRLPGGVEVSMGAEPLPVETALTEYPGEIFRRIIYLAGMGSSPAPDNALAPLQDGAGSAPEEAP